MSVFTGLVQNSKVGDCVFWGTYEQDNNISNGKEEIEWLVLEKEGNRSLLISKYGHDCQPYNEEYDKVTWETCTLRQWLNETFINDAFTEREKSAIPTVSVSVDINSPIISFAPISHKDNFYQDGSVQDKVFLLSVDEVNTYFGSAEEQVCQPTAFSRANGARGTGGTIWHLRSVYQAENMSDSWSYAVRHDGSITSGGVYYEDSVRPAIWVEVE